MAAATKKKLMRLTDILTKEVSLVDKAANKRKWLITKAADMGATLQPDGKGGFITVLVLATPTSGVDVGEPGTVTTGMSKATRVTITKAIEALTALAAMPEAELDSPAVADALTEALAAFEPEADMTVTVMKRAPAELAKAATGCAAKLIEIANALHLVETPDADMWPAGIRWRISDVLDALVTLGNLEASQPGAAAMVAECVGAAYDTPQAMGKNDAGEPVDDTEPTPEEMEKAVWTTAYKDALPDSAFLYVEPGAEKQDGKTTPLSKRHFPVRDASGTVDPAHARNAIARIPQSNAPGLTPEMKTALQKKARNLLPKKEAVAKNDSDAHSSYKKMALGLQMALDSHLGTHENTGVAKFDEEGYGKLMGGATEVITQLKARVATLEARPSPSNAISVEGAAPVVKQKTKWARDLAADTQD